MKKSFMRFITLLVVILTVASFTLVGCKSETSSNPESDGPVELSISWWGNDARAEKFNKILDMYEEANTNVTITRQFAAWGDFWTKTAVQAAGNTLPDTFGMTMMSKGEYVDNGSMIDLKPYIDKGLIDVDNFTQGALDAGKGSDGIQYFITFGDTAACLAYNETLIESTGLDMPTDGMSFDEYRDYLVALQAKLPEGYYAGNQEVSFDHVFENYIEQQGYHLLSDDGKSIGYPKEVLKAFYTYWQDLAELGVVPSAEVRASETGKQWGETLAGQGKIAVFGTNANQLKIFQSTLADKLGVVRSFIEKDAKNKYVEIVQPSGWNISKNSKNQDEAAKLISWFVNDRGAQKVFDMEFGNPGSTDIVDMFLSTLQPDTKPVDHAKKIEMELMNKILTTVQMYGGRPAGAPALLTDMIKKFEDVNFGTKTIDQAVDDHFNAASALLN